MRYLYAVLVSAFLGIVSTAISDTWNSGVIAGSLAVWAGLAIGGHLR